MRFSRSIVLLTLALGLFARPASAQTADTTAAAPPPAAAQAADSAAAAPRPAVDAPVAVAPVQAPVVSTPRTRVPERRSWMFGIGYGYGGARFVGTWQTLTGELRSDTPDEYPTLVTGNADWVDTQVETATTLQYRIGYAVSPTLMIGFERAQWSKDFEDYSWRFSTSTFSATWYPGAKHLYVRGGAGFSAMAEKIPQTAPFFIEFADRGLGLEGAIGYEWDFWKRLSLAPEVSIRHMQYGDQVRAQMGVASLGLNLWF